MRVEASLIPPVIPPVRIQANAEKEPCRYCGILIEPYCISEKYCQKAHAAKIAQSLLDEMRLNQNYNLNT